MEPARRRRRFWKGTPVGGVGVQFVGQGRDYFRIWIADVLCMMLTLGLYWPWMRRRRWQFLNSNTWVGGSRLINPDHARVPGAWPRWWQQAAVGVGLVGLYAITHRYGILGWPRFFALFSLTAPLWILTGWRGRLAQLRIDGIVPVFAGRLRQAVGVWFLMCLLLLPAGMTLGALFLDNLRVWLLGGFWTTRLGISEDARELLPWAAALSLALALSSWFFLLDRFGLGRLTHPAGDSRYRLRLWPLMRAALFAIALVLPAFFVAFGLFYANWPLLLATASIEPPATLEHLSHLAPGADTLLGSLRLDGSLMDGSRLVGSGVCVNCRAFAVGVLALLCGLCMMMGWRYFMVRLWNQRWRRFSMAGHAFESHLPAGRVMATGFICDLLTVLTLGLYHPFGVVRMEKLYREAVRFQPIDAAHSIIVPPRKADDAAVRRPPAGVLQPVPHLPWLPALLLSVLPATVMVVFMLHAKSTLGDFLVHNMPASLERAVGESALRTLQRQGAGPSALSPQSRQRLHDALEAAALRTWSPTELPAWKLEFMRGGEVLGPNALALPGNIIVITDELLALAARQPDRGAVLVGVFGHELLRLKDRQPQRLLLMSSLRKSLMAVVLRSSSATDDLLASGADTILNLGYNAASERDADLGARRMLQANGYSPTVMIGFLRDLRATRHDNPAWTISAQRIPIGLASQPLDTMRLLHFASDDNAVREGTSGH